MSTNFLKKALDRHCAAARHAMACRADHSRWSQMPLILLDKHPALVDKHVHRWLEDKSKYLKV